MKKIASLFLLTIMFCLAANAQGQLLIFHEVKPQQTIDGVAGMYQVFGVTKDDIIAENKGLDANNLREGQVLKVKITNPFSEAPTGYGMSDTEFFRKYYGSETTASSNKQKKQKEPRATKPDKKKKDKPQALDENGNPIPDNDLDAAIQREEPEEKNPMDLNLIKNDNFSLSVYVDAYYAAYSDVADSLKFPAFQSVSPINKSIGLNILQLAGGYSKDKLRMNFAIHLGDIPRFSWSGPYNYIQEANIGYNVWDDIWVDVGYFTTHIGTESMTPKDNIMSTWALNTFHEPLFQGGVKVSYEGENGVSAALHVLDGYNAFVSSNNKLSFGLGLGWEPSDVFAMGYSNQISDESATTDEQDQTRFYNNLWSTLSFEKVFVQLGFDFALQTNSKLEHLGDGTAIAYGALASVKYNMFSSFGLFGRVEYFEDQHGFLSGTFEETDGYERGLNATAYTLGAEYNPTDNTYLRFEHKQTITPNRSNLQPFQNFWKDSAPVTNKQSLWMVTVGMVVDL